MQTRHYLNGLGMTVLRPLAAGIALAVIGFAAPHASFADDNALTITSWGGTFQDMEQQTFFDPFTKETGIKVNQDNWDGELSKIRAMVDTGNVTWDLVVADYGHAIAGCAEGILEPIDYSKLGNVDDFLPGTAHKCGISSDIYSL